MSTATVTTQAQITIPTDLRWRLGLALGDRVEFVEIDGGFAIKPAIDDIRSL
jgi:AbrB family looped-hinge helix DNA binding protein